MLPLTEAATRSRVKITASLITDACTGGGLFLSRRGCACRRREEGARKCSDRGKVFFFKASLLDASITNSCPDSKNRPGLGASLKTSPHIFYDSGSLWFVYGESLDAWLHWYENESCFCIAWLKVL
jgi:hypothetical protein